MRRTQDVYFFTLIDLLLQLLFVAVIFWTLQEQKSVKNVLRPDEQEQVKTALSKSGFSTITELTDWLTRMAPVARDEAVRAVAEAGGLDSLRDMKRMLDSIRAGTGLSPCIFKVVDGRRVGIAQGRIIATDDSLRVVSMDEQLLNVLGKTSDDVLRGYSLKEFKQQFASLAPGNCRRTVEVQERTDRIFARDAIGRIFSRIPVK